MVPNLLSKCRNLDSGSKIGIDFGLVICRDGKLLHITFGKSCSWMQCLLRSGLHYSRKGKLKIVRSLRRFISQESGIPYSYLEGEETQGCD